MAYLASLTEEQLALKVVTEGCDCYGDVGSGEVWADSIFLGRYVEPDEV